MCVFGNPLLHFDIQPETINPQGYNRKQKPLDIIPEKLTSGYYQRSFSGGVRVFES